MVEDETILITGASGFIGGWLTETLILSGASFVRAGIRSWSSAARLARFPVDIVLCDVLNIEQIRQAMADVTIVIHCATGLNQVIVQGTHNMLEMALEQGVKRFVHLSTTEVYGNVDGQTDEERPFQVTGNEYGDSKIEAENLCCQYWQRGLPVTTVRPSIVYGPFSEDWVIRISQKLQSGNWGLFDGYGGGFCNLVYVTDVVAGILLAATHPAAIGQAFNLSGREVITWNQYFQDLNAALGLPDLKEINPVKSKMRASIMRPIKASAKSALQHLEDPLKKLYERSAQARRLMQFAEKSMKTTASFSDLNLYNRRTIYSIEKAQRLLGYAPQVDTQAGIEMSASWLKHLSIV